MAGTYTEKTDKIIVQERTKMSKPSSNTISEVQKFPYDEYNSHHGEYDRSDSYLSHGKSYSFFFLSVVTPIHGLL